MKFTLETNLQMKVVKRVRHKAYDWLAVRELPELPNKQSKQGLHDSAYLSTNIRTVLGLNSRLDGVEIAQT